MKTTATITPTQYQALVNQHATLSQRVEQLERKLDMFASLKEFDELTRWGRAFAKKNKIKPSNVLEDD